MNVIVVGGGLAGLAATMRLAERGLHVKLVALTAARRSHSVCAQGGINAALNLAGEDDSPYIHAYDTIKGGDFLANQPPVVEMCLAAPKIIEMMDRFGCPFNRVASGHLDVRRFGGTLYNRTVFCGASTGQQLLYTLDEQVRRLEVKARVQRFENHEFLRLLRDEKGRACGIVLTNLFNQKIETMRAEAVVFATGGLGMLFRQSTNSTFCTGAVHGRLYEQGLAIANAEFIQIHPTAIPGEDKLRLISESVRGEGGRIWVFGDSAKQIQTPDGREIPCGESGKPWYFLEQLYPAYGNLVARDVASREILRIVEMGLGVEGKSQVYLDVRHLEAEKIKKLASVLDIYEKFTGVAPTENPMKVFIAPHYSMGGLWVDWPAADAQDRLQRYRQMTSVAGCFAAGECEYQYHGANRLGANALLSCIFSGLVAADEIHRYIESENMPLSINERAFSEGVLQEVSIRDQLMQASGSENIYQLHEELSHILIRHVTVRRDKEGLEQAVAQIEQLQKRYENVGLQDQARFANQSLTFARQLRSMLAYGKLMAQCALARNESRGAHYRLDYPKRDDAQFLKTTVAIYDGNSQAHIYFEPVDTRHVVPHARDYVQAHKGAVELKNIPTKIQLPL